MTDNKKSYLFGLKNIEESIKKNYSWGLPINKCDPDNPSDEHCDVTPISPVNPEHYGTGCYGTIKEEAKRLKLTKYDNVNTCIQKLNSNLRCSAELPKTDDNNTDNNFLRCDDTWADRDNDKIKNACHTPDNTLENIINYCVNQTKNPYQDICNKEYETPQFKNVKSNKKLSEFNTNSKYKCEDDCNTESIKVPSISKFSYNNTLNNQGDKMNCHEMQKLIFNCNKLSEKDNNEFETVYKDFVKNGKYDYNLLIKNDPGYLDKLLKYSMCKIASENIDIIKGAKFETNLTEWWNYNIFNKYDYKDEEDPNKMHESGFQRNIFYISFFIVLFLKLTILSKFNISMGETTFLNKILPIVSIIFSLIIFYCFVNKLEIISSLSSITFILSTFSIIIGLGFYIKDKIWSKVDSSKQVLAFLLVIGILMLVIKAFTENNTFASVAILIYFIFISIFFVLKSEKSTITFKVTSILILAIFLVAYLLNQDVIYSTIYFYILIFLVLIFIICANNTDLFYKKFNGSDVSKYKKIINIIIRPFKKEDGVFKYVLLTCYFIFALADSFISVLSPQMSLVIMIIFRLILNRWYEPINAVFVSLSGYSMSNIDGTQETMMTSNKGILDFDNLLSLFTK